MFTTGLLLCNQYLLCWLLTSKMLNYGNICVLWSVSGRVISLYGQHDIVLANSKLLSQYKCHGEAQALQHHLETLHHHWLAGTGRECKSGWWVAGQDGDWQKVEFFCFVISRVKGGHCGGAPAVEREQREWRGVPGVGIVIHTRTVWRPTLECLKKVNELQRKEMKMFSSPWCTINHHHHHVSKLSPFKISLNGVNGWTNFSHSHKNIGFQQIWAKVSF